MPLFALQIRMPRPDTEGRYDILRLQLTSKHVSPDVDLLQLARDLPGLVGADLANIVNEAQLNGKGHPALRESGRLSHNLGGSRCVRAVGSLWHKVPASM
jgi:ATP-dependent 26S proteasome regulatory subunit